MAISSPGYRQGLGKRHADLVELPDHLHKACSVPERASQPATIAKHTFGIDQDGKGHATELIQGRQSTIVEPEWKEDLTVQPEAFRLLAGREAIDIDEEYGKTVLAERAQFGLDGKYFAARLGRRKNHQKGAGPESPLSGFDAPFRGLEYDPGRRLSNPGQFGLGIVVTPCRAGEDQRSADAELLKLSMHGTGESR
ncbi:MAG: hypothetical protein GVY32_13030 [Gammaproteobacteria bacterium]|jgi:hypothetical protein|nr:hypothetical protein [Gammaproteobacteria bacterium]